MLEEKIYQDYTAALKAKDKVKTDFLSFIRAELKNQAIALRKNKLLDSEALAVLKKQQKRLLDSKDSIIASGRADLIQNIEREFTLLAQYLPKPLSDAELTGIINKALASLESPSMKDMGKMMKEVLAEAGIRADAKKVSAILKTKLAGGAKNPPEQSQKT